MLGNNFLYSCVWQGSKSAGECVGDCPNSADDCTPDGCCEPTGTYQIPDDPDANIDATQQGSSTGNKEVHSCSSNQLPSGQGAHYDCYAKKEYKAEVTVEKWQEYSIWDWCSDQKISEKSVNVYDWEVGPHYQKTGDGSVGCPDICKNW